MDFAMDELFSVEDVVQTDSPLRIQAQMPMPQSTYQQRAMYSPGGTYISQPPRRPKVLRNLLIDSPSRISYRLQMSKHWRSPQTYRQRSASPRRTPAEIRSGPSRVQSHIIPAKRVKTISHNDSSSPPGGVPIPASPSSTLSNGLDGANDSAFTIGGTNEATLQGGVPLLSDTFTPMHELEAAIAQSFDSPSPDREERRKTLHISTPTRTSQSAKSCNSPSSSDEWTGDDVFLPRPLIQKRNEVRVDQMRAPPRQHQAMRCPVGSTCTRSPLRQRQDSSRMMSRKSRFRVVAPATAPSVSIPIESQSVRSSSDADDEDESSEASSGVSE